MSKPAKSKERKQLQERRLIIISIAILLLVGGTIIWILNSQGIIQGSWSSILLIIFTVFGIIIGLFQWLYPISSSSSQPSQQSQLSQSSQSSQPHPITAEAQPLPQIIVHMPPTAAALPLTQIPEKAPYRGIVGVPPPTDPRTIQQRQRVVQD